MLAGQEGGAGHGPAAASNVNETESLLRRAVLRLCMLAEGVHPPFDPLLDALRTAARHEDDPDTLATAFHALSDALVRHDPAAPLTPAGASAPAAGDWLELAHALAERLYVPDSLLDRAGTVRATLAQADAKREAGQALVDLTAAARACIETDQATMQTFLAQLAERLAQLEGSTSRSREQAAQALVQAGEFDTQMRAGLTGLRTAGADARNLDELRTALSGHLASVENTLSTHRAATQARLDDLAQELTALHRRVERMDGETRELRTRVESAQAEALRDPLTGIPNRLAYERRAPAELVRCRTGGIPFTLVMCDVDHFKAINDRYGHVAGDKVLRATATLLAGTVRGADFVARAGGEEFIVLLPGAALAQGCAVAEKLRLAVQEAGFRYRGEPVRVTMSCGVAACTGNDTLETLYERADAALYQAKAQGRNRSVCAEVP